MGTLTGPKDDIGSAAKPEQMREKVTNRVIIEGNSRLPRARVECVHNRVIDSPPPLALAGIVAFLVEYNIIHT